MSDHIFSLLQPGFPQAQAWFKPAHSPMFLPVMLTLRGLLYQLVRSRQIKLVVWARALLLAVLQVDFLA